MSNRISVFGDFLQTHGKAVEVIGNVCEILGFPVVTYCTAHYLYHKFFATPRHEAELGGSLLPIEMAMTCVFVASKMEETVKKTRDVALATLKAVHEDDEGLLQDIDGTFMEECRKIIITYERELLDAIQYQFEIKHPCAFIIKFTRRLALEKSMAKTAWRLMVMVYRSTVPVYYGPHAVASACIFVAQKLYRETVDNPTEIFSIFSVFKLQLLEITAKILDVLVESDPTIRHHVLQNTDWEKEEIKSLQIEINQSLRELSVQSTRLPPPIAPRPVLDNGSLAADRRRTGQDEHLQEHTPSSPLFYERVPLRSKSRSITPHRRRRERSRDRRSGRRKFSRSRSCETSSSDDDADFIDDGRRHNHRYRRSLSRSKRRDYSPYRQYSRRDRSRDIDDRPKRRRSPDKRRRSRS